MNTKKSWSVILLMAIGSLFVTVAGCIFISNTWMLLSEIAKKICLAMLTAGLFAGSHLTSQKISLKITSKALFYLASVILGFTTFLCFDFLNDTSLYGNINLIRFSVAILFMMIAVVYMYIKEGRTADYSILYVLTNTFIISLFAGLELGAFAVALAISICSFILGIVDTRIQNKPGRSEAAFVTSKVFFLLETMLANLFALLTLVSSDSFGETTLVSAVLLVANVIPYLIDKNEYYRIFSTISIQLSIIFALVDVSINGDFVPSYYMFEVVAFAVLICIALIRIIWYDNEGTRDSLGWFSFIAECMIFSGLLFHNFSTNELACVLTLGISAFATLIYTSITNDRKRQILYGIILFVMVINLTKAFWLSIAWWVYLFFAGVICFALAIIKEKKFSANVPVIKVTDVIENNSETI